MLDSSNDTARLSLAKALIGLDRQPDALPILNQVLQHKPQDAEAHYLRGRYIVAWPITSTPRLT